MKIDHLTMTSASNPGVTVNLVLQLSNGNDTMRLVLDLSREDLKDLTKECLLYTRGKMQIEPGSKDDAILNDACLVVKGLT